MAASPAMLVPVVVSISPVMAALAPERNPLKARIRHDIQKTGPARRPSGSRQWD